MADPLALFHAALHLDVGMCCLMASVTSDVPDLDHLVLPTTEQHVLLLRVPVDAIDRQEVSRELHHVLQWTPNVPDSHHAVTLAACELVRVGRAVLDALDARLLPEALDIIAELQYLANWFAHVEHSNTVVMAPADELCARLVRTPVEIGLLSVVLMQRFEISWRKFRLSFTHYVEVDKIYRFIVRCIDDNIWVELIPFNLQSGASFATVVFLEGSLNCDLVMTIVHLIEA